MKVWLGGGWGRVGWGLGRFSRGGGSCRAMPVLPDMRCSLHISGQKTNASTWWNMQAWFPLAGHISVRREPTRKPTQRHSHVNMPLRWHYSHRFFFSLCKSASASTKTEYIKSRSTVGVKKKTGMYQILDTCYSTFSTHPCS